MNPRPNQNQYFKERKENLLAIAAVPREAAWPLQKQSFFSDPVARSKKSFSDPCQKCLKIRSCSGSKKRTINFNIFSYNLAVFSDH